MKKLVYALLVSLLVISLIGCSSETSNQKTEEELRAEIQAEMEAEEQLREELKEEIQAELEAENQEKNSENESQEKDSPSSEDKNSSNPQEISKVHAADLQVGDIVSGKPIDHFTYTKNQEFAIGLDGEFTVTGRIEFDEMDGGYALFIDSVSGDLTEVTFVFDDSEYTANPPDGYIVLDGDNLQVVESAIGNTIAETVESGKALTVEAVIKDYGFYAKANTSPMFFADIVAINSYSLE